MTDKQPMTVKEWTEGGWGLMPYDEVDLEGEEMPEMTEQQTDQEALTAAVEWFGVDEWWGGWKENDLSFEEGCGVGVPIIKLSNELLFQYPLYDYPRPISKLEKTIYPYAGTWAEGRIREAMGNAYIELYRVCEGVWHCAYRNMPHIVPRLIAEGPTALRALIAGQLALLEGRKTDV